MLVHEGDTITTDTAIHVVFALLLEKTHISFPL